MPWEEAAKDYFDRRISLRYLHPIKAIQDHGNFQGEGFSIVAIQCSLIEFLEATVQGISYRYLRGGGRLGPYEYSKSSALFVNFLTVRQPFVNDFNQQVAQDFYEGVRCGLLHEARTKQGWTIWGKGPSGRSSVIDATQKSVYRNNFQSALQKFVDWYKQSLP